MGPATRKSQSIIKGKEALVEVGLGGGVAAEGGPGSACACAQTQGIRSYDPDQVKLRNSNLDGFRKSIQLMMRAKIMTRSSICCP